MNWDDPAARLALAESVGPDEYNRRVLEHIKKSTILTVNGHGIRPVSSRFGRLFMVGKTGRAFSTMVEAEDYAGKIPPGS